MSGLFGTRYADLFISPNAPVTDLDGNVIADATGNPGFPGFGAITASPSLGFAAAMQERGIPVTYAYISDAHDDPQTDPVFDTGQAGHVQALDRGFGQFFSRLNKNGITRANTHFVFTADEGDHFVAGRPARLGCGSVHVACTYRRIGELDASMSGLLSTVPPYSTGTPVPSLSVHGDSAPKIYLDGNPRQRDIVTRTVERAAGHIRAVNPITHYIDHVTIFLTGTAAMPNLHMLTSEPRRNPTFTLFAHPDYYLCAAGFQRPFTGSQDPGFAWSHRDIAPEINTTWLGLVGPGVRHMGVNGPVWSSHTDTRPTILGLLGLKDDYRHQCRVLVEVFDRGALPRGIDDVDAYVKLARMYEQVNSPVGQFGRATLAASTAALESGTARVDSIFTAMTRQLEEFGQRRDALVEEIGSDTGSPGFGGRLRPQSQ